MNKERLQEMAQHLESGKLGHEVFDFSQVNNTKEPKCGTLGCAIGELPILHPDHWRWSNCGMPELILPIAWTQDDVSFWFGLSEDETQHLFYPSKQNTYLFGGVILRDNATRYQVAANIRAFIAKMENS